MTPMRHALSARLLIKACGGLEEAASACRVQKSQLQNFQDSDRVQDPDRAQYMPADVIADLEAYCGKPHYSRALVEARPAAAEAVSMMEEASALIEGSAGLFTHIRSSLADGVITPAERRSGQLLICTLGQRLADLSSLLAGAA